MTDILKELTAAAAPYAVPMRLFGTNIEVLVTRTPTNPAKLQDKHIRENITSMYVRTVGYSELGTRNIVI
jgi:hypothetical protein